MKLDEIKIEENVDATIKKVAKAIKGKGFFDLRKSLETIFDKKDISVSDVQGWPLYIIKTGGKKLILVNKKKADDPELVVGDIAIGYLD